MSRIARTGVLAAALLLAAGCRSVGFDSHPAVKDPGADRASADLAGLQSDPDLASRAPAAIKEAQDAVNAAEVPQSDPVLAGHLAYLAQRKVQTARALAEARLAQDRLNGLRAQQVQQTPVVTTAPNGAPVVQLPPGQALPPPANATAPVVPAGPAAPVAPAPAPAPAAAPAVPQAAAPSVTVPPATVTPPATFVVPQTVQPSAPNAPVVDLPQTPTPPPQQQGQGN